MTGLRAADEGSMSSHGGSTSPLDEGIAHVLAPMGVQDAAACLNRRRFSGARRARITVQTSASATLTAAKVGTAKARRSPRKTSPAARTSPARMKKASTACLALYLASRLVGSHSACCAVLPSE